MPGVPVADSSGWREFTVSKVALQSAAV